VRRSERPARLTEPSEQPPAEPWKPTPQQLRAARDKTVADVIAPRLKVLFVGINPGLYSAAIGHHFGRPGNRFWPALYRGGFSERLLTPFEERELLRDGYGITNIVHRASAAADELTKEELIEGGRQLEEKVCRYRPQIVAFLGIMAYRTAFGRKHAVLGRQPGRIGGAEVWVLPNPSGLNAHFLIADLGRLFAELRAAAEH
jgi:TDG/mug DNA glycosylase family protein